MYQLIFLFFTFAIVGSKSISNEAENVTYPEIPRSYWRIETGTESPASGDHFPFLITLNFHQKAGVKNCPSVILNRNWIATAGFCIDQAVNSDAQDMYVVTNGANEQISRILTVYMHQINTNPSANGTVQHLALLKLSVPLNETLDVQRISIAEPETSVGSGVFLGLTYLTNANTSILNIYKSNVTDILSSKDCKKFVEDIGENKFCIRRNLTDLPKESGGVFINVVGDRPVLTGIVSSIRKHSCGHETIILLKTASYADFIKKVLSE